jgi:hypothetical protein
MKRRWRWQAFGSSSFAPYGENTRRRQWTLGCRHFLVANEKEKTRMNVTHRCLMLQHMKKTNQKMTTSLMAHRHLLIFCWSALSNKPNDWWRATWFVVVFYKRNQKKTLVKKNKKWQWTLVPCHLLHHIKNEFLKKPRKRNIFGFQHNCFNNTCSNNVTLAIVTLATSL